MATTGSPATGPAPWLAAGNGADTAPVRANGADSKAAVPAVGTEPVPGNCMIAEALAYHGLPRALIDRLAADGDDPQSALTGALQAQFRFEPLGNHSGAPLALVGPAGAGKTVALAKLAARATLANLPVKVISADGFRAGGIDQLAAFTDILGIELHTAGSPRELERLAAPGETQGLILIDTAGVNPFSKADMLRLVELIASVDAEPVLTLAAGGDPGDAGETGEIFAAIGARRQIVTRLDAVRRLGGVLASAERGNLAFCDIGMSPHVSRGLRGLDAPSLARLLLCHQPPEKPAHLSNEAQ